VSAVQTEGLKNLFFLAKDKISKGDKKEQTCKCFTNCFLPRGCGGISISPPVSPWRTRPPPLSDHCVELKVEN